MKDHCKLPDKEIEKSRRVKGREIMLDESQYAFLFLPSEEFSASSPVAFPAETIFPIQPYVR